MLAVVAASTVLFPALAGAADESFNVQVSPSPLVVTVKPGEYKTTAVTVRNLTAHNETLYPALKGFEVDAKTSAINITDTLPANLAEWVSFKQSVVHLGPGGSQTLDVMYATPKNVGFSYSLAIVLGRQPATAKSGSVRLEGAVALFNLINVDRPDAVSKLDVVSLASKRGMYEFLPAQFTLTVANKGNIIGQPSGTLFIQRSFDDEVPLATIPLNRAEGYVLPGIPRGFTLTWADGFPHYVASQPVDNAEPETSLSWGWKDTGGLRFGKYVAKAVLVYNDGQRDVAVTASTTFWVIPWRLLGAAILVVALIVMGIAASGWLGFKAARKVRGKAGKHRG